MDPEIAVALATSVVVLITAVVGLGTLLVKLGRDVEEIHVMVNSRMDQALARIEQLHDTLRAAGIARPDVPPKP